MSAAATRRRPEDEVGERFVRDTAEHVMKVLLDDGLHRHLKFGKPGTGMYWFEVVTWPGALVIRGDMGTFVFSRLTDMFEFFRGERVNPQYWAEKEISGAETQRFDVDYAARYVREHVADLGDQYEPEDVALIEAAVTALIQDWDFSHSDGVHMLLRDFRVELTDGSDFRFYDTWEWSLTDWTVQFLWCLHAIVSAIKQYDAKDVLPDGCVGGHSPSLVSCELGVDWP